MLCSNTQQSIRDGRNKRLQSLASSTDNTLSSLIDSGSDYDDDAPHDRERMLNKRVTRFIDLGALNSVL